MHEQRTFFRIKNPSGIVAKINKHAIGILDISAVGASITTTASIPSVGMLELDINFVTLSIQYAVLKATPEMTVLVFNREPDIDSLFDALRNLRYEQREKK